MDETARESKTPSRGGNGIKILAMALLVLSVATVTGLLVMKNLKNEKVATVENKQKNNINTYKMALEIYNRTHRGKYPKTLTQLVPEYLDKSTEGMDQPDVYIYTPNATASDYSLCVKLPGKEQECVNGKTAEAK